MKGSTAIAGRSVAQLRARGAAPRRRLRQLRDEAVAVAMPGLDVARLLGVVPERLAQFLDAGGEGVVADDGVAPDRGEQLLLGDRLAGALHQQPQHRRGFARELDLALVGPQPGRRGLEAIASEADVLAHDAQRSRRNPGVRPGLAGRAFVAFWHITGAPTSRAGFILGGSWPWSSVCRSSSTAWSATPSSSPRSSTPSASSATSGCRNRWIRLARCRS